MLNFEKVLFYHELSDFGRHIRLVARVLPDPANEHLFDWHALFCNTPAKPQLRMVAVRDECPDFYEGATAEFINEVDALIQEMHGNMEDANWQKLQSAWVEFKDKWMRRTVPGKRKTIQAEPATAEELPEPD